MEVTAATSDSTLPIESTTPIAPGESPSSRTKNTTVIAPLTMKKKFEVAVASGLRLRFGFPRAKRRPSLSSIQMFDVAPSGVATTGLSSSLRIPR